MMSLNWSPYGSIRLLFGHVHGTDSSYDTAVVMPPNHQAYPLSRGSGTRTQFAPGLWDPNSENTPFSLGKILVFQFQDEIYSSVIK